MIEKQLLQYKEKNTKRYLKMYEKISYHLIVTDLITLRSYLWSISMPVFDHKSTRNIEEELGQARLLLKASLECSRNDYVFSIDRNYNFLFYNNTYKDFIKKIYGFELSVGLSCLDCISRDDDLETVISNFDRAFSGEPHLKIEQIDHVYYEVFYNPIHNEENEIIGVTSQTASSSWNCGARF